MNQVSHVEDEGLSTRVYESDSDDDGFEADSPVAGKPPVHPMPSMQGPFEESIMESVEEQSNPAREGPPLGPKARRQKMIEQDDYNESYMWQWRRKPRAKYHPLWKLMAQISFGVHLLQQKLAKSDEEVVKILQKHVDEVDTYLEKTTEDFDLAYMDIKERINYLQLPLEHVNIFDMMLDDKRFRTSIVDGNEKIEKIVERTARAKNDSLVDVSKGVEAVTELATYLNGVGGKWVDSDEQTAAIYNAMRGNAEGWYRCFRTLEAKGSDLSKALAQLSSILNEMSKRAGVASRRAVWASLLILQVYRNADCLQAPSRGSDMERRSSRTTPRSNSPAFPTPTSRFSSVAHLQSKPLPRVPRSGASTPLRLETPSVNSPRPGSPALSTRSGNSPLSHSPANRSPLAGSPHNQSPRSRSPLIQSPRAESPAVPRESVPFEGKFEQARAAPKPPVKDVRKPKPRFSPLVDEKSEEISALPQPSSFIPSRKGSLSKTPQDSGFRRSGSLIKRLRGGGSKDLRQEANSREKKQSHPKHERSMTSDLKDLFRSAGHNESPRNSRIVVDSKEKPSKLRKKSVDLLGSKSSPKDLPEEKITSPAHDSAYASALGDSPRGNARSESLSRIDSEETPIADNAIPQRSDSTTTRGSSRPASPVPPRSESRTESRTGSRAGSRLADRPMTSSRAATPSPLTQPAYANHNDNSARSPTPTGRGRFGLFPSNRPMTPSAMSIQSSAGALEGRSEYDDFGTNRPRFRKGSLPLPSIERITGDVEVSDGAPAPGVPRQKRRSSTGMRNGKDAVQVFEDGSGLKEAQGLRRNSILKKKSSFSRLKDWMGRRRGESPLREVKE